MSRYSPGGSTAPVLFTPDFVNEYAPPATVVIDPEMSSTVAKMPSRPAPSRVTVAPLTPAVSAASRVPLELRSIQSRSPMVTARKKPASTVLLVSPGTTLTLEERPVPASTSESTVSSPRRSLGLSV